MYKQTHTISHAASPSLSLVLASQGRKAEDRILAIGEAVPGLGGACCVAREILNDVKMFKDRADDVVAAGRRVVDVLKLLNKIEENADSLAADAKEEVKERIDDLRKLLVAVRGAVKAFGKKGFFKQMIEVGKQARVLSKLDEEIRDVMDYILRLYKIAKDEQIIALLNAQTYKLEAAIDAQIDKRMKDGATDERPAAAIKGDEEAIQEIADAGGVLQSEVREFRDEVRQRFEDLREQLLHQTELLERYVGLLEQLEHYVGLLQPLVVLVKRFVRWTSPRDQGRLLEVFEVVLAKYDTTEAEEKAAEDLDDFLYIHGSSICKKELLKPFFFGLTTKRRCTPLHVACALGKIHLAQSLHGKGFDINCKDVKGRLPFHYAARHGHLKVVEWIIDLHKAREPKRLLNPSSEQLSLSELLKSVGWDNLNALDLAVLAEKDEVKRELERHLEECKLSQTIRADKTKNKVSELIQERENS